MDFEKLFWAALSFCVVIVGICAAVLAVRFTLLVLS